ncbi:MAG: PIG-L family deacetylase [Chloroflexota bacterium]
MTHYHAIYLSPHLDDAVLSCGGQIHQRTQRGERVLIATVTAGNPSAEMVSAYAQSLHNRWELLTEAVEGRRQEDIRAAAILNADTLHWPIPDCIYRYHEPSGTPYYTSDEEIFGEIHLGERGVVQEIAQLIEQLPSHETLLAPLGVGHHVDHLLTRTAAEITTTQLTYYEEYPYAQEVDGATEQVVSRLPIQLTPRIISLHEMDVSARIESIAQYESQLSTFFTGRDDLACQVSSFVQKVDGERTWQRVK